MHCNINKPDSFWDNIIELANKESGYKRKKKPKDYVWVKIGGHNNLLNFVSNYGCLIMDITQYGLVNSGRYRVKMSVKDPNDGFYLNEGDK